MPPQPAAMTSKDTRTPLKAAERRRREAAEAEQADPA
jgi:hypothetical protein